MKLVHKAFCYAVYAAMIPLLPVLMVGRVLFFKITDAWFVLSGWVDGRPGAAGRALPFWLAWCAALGWVATAIAIGFVGFTWGDGETPGGQAILYLLLLALALLALFMAYRAALAGTEALQRNLAENLATLIAFELDQLRLETALRVEAATRRPAVPSEPMRVPDFLAERAEIRALLGEPTELALVHLLDGLEMFNHALLSRRNAELNSQLAEVHGLLGAVMNLLWPYLRRIA